MVYERRLSPTGVAVLTQRSLAIKQRLNIANIDHRLLAWPTHSADLPLFRPPLLFDTVGVPYGDITRLLLNLSHATIGLVDPDDSITIRLCSLSPAIRLLIADHTDFVYLRPTLDHLAEAQIDLHRIACSISVPTEWINVPNQEALELVTALETSACLIEAATQLHLSRSTFFRRLNELRSRLDLSAEHARLSSNEWASTIYTAIMQTD
jgi:AraC-like DNA-binding protein